MITSVFEYYNTFMPYIKFIRLLATNLCAKRCHFFTLYAIGVLICTTLQNNYCKIGTYTSYLVEA